MKKELKRIVPGYGLGTLKFGTTREDVKALLGEPDETESYAFEESPVDTTESWHYDELELSMSFDEEADWRLTTVSVSSDEFILERFHPVGMRKEELLAELSRLDIRDLQHEDYSTDETPNQELYSSEDLAMNFWLEEGVVSEIQWGPLFIDEDTVDWPA
ncbi:MAG: hypothetical protein JW801_18365 [Bacteroidales bacterium]|nr:hypothetical protein [Bacteroidales bacterium]